MTLPDPFLHRPLAHRALHDVRDGRPENSRAAIRAAIDKGYGIEIDVQLSADGAAMVFHDYALQRLTGRPGVIRAHSTAELAEIRLIGNDEGVPTLPEVLEIVAGQVPLVVELKDQDGTMGTDIGPLETAVAAALASYKGAVAVMSFNPNSVALMASLSPDIPRGIVTSAYRYDEWPLPKPVCDRLREIPDYAASSACFISHEVDDLGRPRVSELKDAGASVLCWTVRSAEIERDARRIADNVTFEGYLARLDP